MPTFLVIHNQSRTIEKPARILRCDSFLCRFRGLMFRSSLPVDEGILLEIGRDSRLDSSIHMFFVPFDLAVFWINSDQCVVDKVIAKPWRPAYFPAQPARYTLEMHPSRFNDYAIGDRVEFRNA